MNVLIDAKSGMLIQGSPDHIIEGSIEGSRYLLFGTPILFESNAFNPRDLQNKFKSLDEIITKLTGDFILFEVKHSIVSSFSVDFFGHARFYYTELKSGLIQISDKVELIDFDRKDVTYDYYQILFFLLKGYTWKGGTFFNQIKIIVPSVKYSIIETKIFENVIKISNKSCKETLPKIMANVLKGISDSVGGNELNLMFSGGKDSTFIALILSKLKFKFNAIFSRYTSPTLSLNILDAMISSNISKVKGFNYIELPNDAKKDINIYINRTIGLLPFDFHVSVAQRNIIEYASSSKSRLIITGQNADSIYNFGFTGTYKHYKAIIKYLLCIIKEEEYENFVNRYFQMNKVLHSIERGKPSLLTRIIWNKFNPHYELTLENIITAFIFTGNVIPTVKWEKMESLTTIAGKEFVYTRNDTETKLLLHSYKNSFFNGMRDLLVRIKLFGHCQGRDVRCITEWCKNYNMKCVQVYSSAPVFFKILSFNLTLKDVYQPKYYIFKYLNKILDYKKIDEKVQKKYNNIADTKNESELFTTLVNQIDKNILLQAINYALNIMRESFIFNIENIRKKANDDSVFRFQLFWLGTSLMKINREASKL